jgi:DNA-binding PadR family transcriptional regulator
MTSREHAELLVLVALRAGPADGREVAARLRSDSGGRLHAPANTVYRTLHRLARGRLLERRDDAGRPRYHLTESGSRVARSRVREWQSLSRAMDAVVRSNLSP